MQDKIYTAVDRRTGSSILLIDFCDGRRQIMSDYKAKVGLNRMILFTAQRAKSGGDLA